MRDINKKFSVRYYLNLVLIDEEERRYFKQQVRARLLLQAPMPLGQNRRLSPMEGQAPFLPRGGNIRLPTIAQQG